MKIIIVANSPKKSFASLYHLNPSDYFIGIDGGCSELLKRNIIPDIAIGDFDSTNMFDTIQEKAITTKVFPSKKNETDLELALMHLATIKGATNLIIEVYDALSGRLDHELLAIKLLQKYAQYKIKLIDEVNTIQLVKENSQIEIKENQMVYFSLIPINEAVVSVRNALYPLDHITIHPLDTYTTSNGRLDEKTIPTVCVHQGMIYLIIIKNQDI